MHACVLKTFILCHLCSRIHWSELEQCWWYNSGSDDGDNEGRGESLPEIRLMHWQGLCDMKHHETTWTIRNCACPCFMIWNNMKRCVHQEGHRKYNSLRNSISCVPFQQESEASSSEMKKGKTSHKAKMGWEWRERLCPALRSREEIWQRQKPAKTSTWARTVEKIVACPAHGNSSGACVC